MSRILSADEINENVIRLLSGTVDPTAGGGIARAIGSLYERALAGSVSAYLKTAAAATGWSRLAQSFGWKSVKDYGAVGDDSTDDTTAVQNAINDVNAAGGGTVFVPFGTYRISQLSMNGMTGVQVFGSGAGSVLKWNFNAGGAAGSFLSLGAGAARCRLSQIRFDGSLLTNPAAGRSNHLVLVGSGAGTTLENHIDECWFGAMPATSGDGVHVVGTAGNLVSRLWIIDNEFDGCSHFSVGVEQGWQYGWILDNYMTNCETEIGFVSTANVNTDSIQCVGNEINHTGSVRHAMRFEGDSTGLLTRLQAVGNLVLGGFMTASNLQYAMIAANQVFSGAFASADPVCRVFGGFSDSMVVENTFDRDPGASAGQCITVEKSGSAPTRFAVKANICIQEVATSGGIKFVDCNRFSCSQNIIRATNAGATTIFAIEAQAVTVDLDDAIIGASNQVSAAAGTFKAAVRLLANGANILACSVVSNQGNQIDAGAQFEIGGGGGNFTNALVQHAGNNWNAGTTDFVNVGVTFVPHVGFNAGPFGPNLFEGDGTPESAVVGRIGSMYLRRDGGQATAVYYKESGTSNTGWIGLGGSPITFGAGDTTAAATAVFMGPGYITTAPATEPQQPMTRPGTIRNLRVQVATAGVGSQTVTYTIRKNGVDTALLTTINNTSTGLVSDLADTFTVVAGDLLSLKITKAAGVTSGQLQVIATVELV